MLPRAADRNCSRRSTASHCCVSFCIAIRSTSGRLVSSVGSAYLMEQSMATNWTPDQPIVQCIDVRKSFGAFEVLKGISLSVKKSEVICIIGPSGSGKSTLIRCINALQPISSGSIQIEGTEVSDPKLDKLALRRKVGMVFQQYNLFPHKTALQNVMMAPIHVLGQDRREVETRAQALLAKVRLAGKEHSYPGELSGGQQQRVAIA